MHKTVQKAKAGNIAKKGAVAVASLLYARQAVKVGGASVRAARSLNMTRSQEKRIAGAALAIIGASTVYGVHKAAQAARVNRAINNYAKKHDPVRKAKDEYKKANKQYSKDYNRAYGYSARHPITQWHGKNKKESDSRWHKAYDSATVANKAQENYKKIKKKYK